MPVYAMRDRWRVRVWVRGQRFDRIAPVGATKADALRLEAEMRLEHGADATQARSRAVPTLSQLCLGSYSAHARAALAPRTWTNRRYQLATIVEHLGSVRVDRITPADLLAFVNARRATAGPATIRDDLKVLSAVLTHGRKVDRLPIPRVAFPAVRDVRRSARERARAWSDEEVARLLAACSPRVADLVAFIADTGVRKGEALHLRWESVDLDAGVAWIEPHDGWTPKTRGSTRAVPLTPAIVERLRPRRQDAGPVFPASERRVGQPRASWPQRDFDTARRAAGLVGGPHTLRHSFASRFLRAGGSLFELGRLLGHTTSRTTELYAHLVPDHLAAAAARVAAASVAGTVRTTVRSGADAGQTKAPEPE